MIFEPMPAGTGVEFSDEVVGGRIPREFIPSVEHAIVTECKRGQVAGYEVVDFKARLIDGKYHDVDSSALAFEIAGRAAFREAHRNSRPKLLEPIMKIEVVTEAEYLGTIIGDVNRRRGQVTEQGQKGNQATVAGLRAAVRDVRLHQLPALGDERPRHLHDGIRPLLRSAAGPRPEADGRRGLAASSALAAGAYSAQDVPGGTVMRRYQFPFAALAASFALPALAQTPAAPALDFDFFKTRVQPILTTKRDGNARCISCHGFSTTMKLQPLPEGAATWSDADARKNFELISARVLPGQSGRKPAVAASAGRSRGRRRPS